MISRNIAPVLCALTIACLLPGLNGCGPDNVSSDALAEDLLTTYEAQKDERVSLLSSTRGAWAKVKDSTKGDPAQINEASRTLEKRGAEFNEKLAEASLGIVAAEVALVEAQATAQTFVNRAHYDDSNVWCGGDGCGGSCSEKCSFDKLCFNDRCRCIPTCGDRQCGDDGCGGVCGDNLGSCGGDQYCNEDFMCLDHSYATKECKPSCSRNGNPARGERIVKEAYRDRSVPRYKQRPNKPSFELHESLVGYLSALDGQANELRQAAKESAKTIAKAARSGDPEAGAVPSQADVDAAKEAASSAATAYSEVKAALKALEKEHRGESKQMGKYAKAEARMRTESARLTAISIGWKQALDAVASAEVALVTATEAAQPAIDEVVAKYGSEVEAAEEELADLRSPAFDDELAAVWTCNGPACPTDRAMLRKDNSWDMGALAKAVKRLHASRKAGLAKHTSALDAQAKSESEPDPDEAQLAAYPEWADEVFALQDASIYLDELVGANERTIGLRLALFEARSDLL